jgi:HEAT repeat protein
MSPTSPLSALERARVGMRRTAVRHQLEAVASGKSKKLSLNLEDKRVDLGSALGQLTRRFLPESPQVQRLAWTFYHSGITDNVIDRLASSNAIERRTSARIVGALYLERTVSWIAPLVLSRDRLLSDAAARALGRIGGARSAEALLMAIHRSGLRRTLITELARAAPDLFLEVVMTESNPQRPTAVPAAALAAGLRRRHTAIGPLLALLGHGNRKERVISCRSLGWIGSGTATSALIGALEDGDWKVRMSAAKALGALRAGLAEPNLERLLGDRNPRVSKAAESAHRRLGRGERVASIAWL